MGDVRSPRLLRETHELPVPHPDLQIEDSLLPRTSSSSLGTRDRLSLRTIGCRPWVAAKPGFHAGRLAHLLPPRPSRRGDGRTRRLLQGAVFDRWTGTGRSSLLDQT